GKRVAGKVGERTESGDRGRVPASARRLAGIAAKMVTGCLAAGTNQTQRPECSARTEDGWGPGNAIRDGDGVVELPGIDRWQASSAAAIARRSDGKLTGDGTASAPTVHQRPGSVGTRGWLAQTAHVVARTCAAPRSAARLRR